jgi:hypothetical protein
MGTLTGRWNAVEVLNGLTRLMPLAAQVGANIGMAKAARYILDIANRYYVPVDSTKLRDSGKVIEEGGSTALLTKTQIASREMSSVSSFSVSIVYDAPYAVFVHEDETKRHGKAYNSHYNGKGGWRKDTETAKFLEVAMANADVGNMGVTAQLGRSLRESFQRILKNPGRYGYSGGAPEITAVRQGMSIIRQSGW